MKKLGQQGLAHVLFVLCVVIILGAIGFAGWRVLENREDEDDEASTSLTEPTTPCGGRLYDSHAHPDDDAIIESLPDIMSKYDIGCSVLFTQMDLQDIDESLELSEEDYSRLPDRIAVFYDVIEDDPSQVTRAKLDDLWQKSGGNFNGFGEFAFYEESFRGKQLTDDGWTTLFEFAAEKDLVIMIHPQQEMLASLGTMLERHPDTKVLIHGPEYPAEVTALLQTYPNLYYTLDTATLFVLGELTPETIPENLFYPGGGPNTEFDVDAFVDAYDSKREQILSQAVDKWLPVLLAAPEKVLWGTDISREGHVDDEVYSRAVDMTDAFAQRIPEQYRQGYLRDNAFELIGAGVGF